MKSLVIFIAVFAHYGHFMVEFNLASCYQILSIFYEFSAMDWECPNCSQILFTFQILAALKQRIDSQVVSSVPDFDSLWLLAQKYLSDRAVHRVEGAQRSRGA